MFEVGKWVKVVSLEVSIARGWIGKIVRNALEEADYLEYGIYLSFPLSLENWKPSINYAERELEEVDISMRKIIKNNQIQRFIDELKR